MRVSAESLRGRNPVFVDDAQGPKAPVSGVIVSIERECVIRVEPSVIEVTALVSVPDLDHSFLQTQYDNLGTALKVSESAKLTAEAKIIPAGP